jgi:prevent-host-death family protein
MKVASLTKVKNELSRYVDEVRRGSRVRILVRGVPAADLVPLTSDASTPGDGFSGEEVADLEARGVIRRGKRGRCAELDRPGPKVGNDAGTRALLDERRAGR